MEAVGKIFKIMPEQSGEGRNGRWVRQEFVIETEDQFPRKICFSMWGEDKVAGLKQLALGEKVVVSFNAESREFNDRWYTDLRCWKLDKQVTQSVTGSSNTGWPPQNTQSYQANSAPQTESIPENDFGSNSPLDPDDDLPF